MKALPLVVLCAGGALAQTQDVFIQRVPPPGDPGAPSVRFFSRTSDATVKGAPYSADTITEHIQTLADGNRIVQRNKTRFARDSQGRTRREMDIVGLGRLGRTAEPLVSVLIDDPVAGTQHHLDPRAKTVTRSKSRRAQPAKPNDLKPGEAREIEVDIQFGPAVFVAEDEQRVEQLIEQQVVERREVRAGGGPVGSTNAEELGERTFEGIRAQGRRLTLTIPAGAEGNERPIEVVTETWYSPQLKTPVYTRHTDPRFGESITKLVNVQLGEPSAHLFQVPADYKEQAAPAPGQRIIVRDEQ